METQTASWLKLIAVATLSSVLGLAGCTKKRTEKIAPGQGDHLQTVSSYNGKVFPLQTLQAVGQLESLNVSKSKSTGYKSAKFGLDEFAIVNYKTDAKLLGSTKVVARPNTTGRYEIHYVMTNDYLKVVKVANETDIPLHERSYADEKYSSKLGNGRLAIPLVGYKIQGKYVLDNIQNELGQKTSLLREKSVYNISEATHFRIDEASPEIFKAVQKPDLLPVSYFDGEWYYAETVVQAPDDKKEAEGGLMELGIGSSTRIKFIKNKDNFEAVSLNLDERLKKQSDINFQRVFSLPVEWKDYRAVEVGNDSGMREEENTEISWNNRRFVLVNFEKVISAMSTNSFEGGNLQSAKMVNIEVEDNYLSFTLEQNESNLRFKISLRRVGQTTYQPKIHFKDDWKKFGFFTTMKSSIDNFEKYRKEDFEKNSNISRFDPRRERIEFRFSKSSPEWVRAAVRNSIIAWDDTFCRAFNGVNSPVCDEIQKCKVAAVAKDRNNETCGQMATKGRYPQIVLNEKDGDVDLGDLRYNIINMIESESDSNLFGLGPSLTDPYTGEIISATTNVHVTPIRSALIEHIRNYTLMKLGYMSTVELGGIFKANQEKVEVDSERGIINFITRDFVQVESLSLPKEILKYMSPTLQSKLGNTKSVTFNFKAGNYPFGREVDLAVTAKNIHREIEHQCPEVVQYVNSLKGTGKSHNEKEIEVLDKCSRRLVLGKMAGTLVHELGHNFGLRHNFMGSNDVANFWPTSKTGGEVVKSSSTMEYPAFNEDRLTSPGLYDIAAIQYGYADKITLADGSTKILDVRRTIDSNVQGQNAKAFKFCTDEDVILYNLDPMCRRHDAGTTPTEVVDNFINEYKSSYVTSNYRYDRAGAASNIGIANWRTRAYYAPMRHFYEKWRTLMAEYLGQDKMYLEGMDEKQYEEVANAIMRDPKIGAEAKELKTASDKAFNFLMSLASQPNQYCLVMDSVGSFNLVELEKVRLESSAAGRHVLTSCQDPVADIWFAANGLKAITQFGYPVNDVRFDMRPENTRKPVFSSGVTENPIEPHDITGTGAERMFAVVMLTSRGATSLRSKQLGLSPNFLDVPSYRRQYIEATLNRIANGVSVDQIANALKLSISAEDIEKLKAHKPFFKKFEYEKDLIQIQLSSLIQGLQIPGKQTENIQRLGAFQVTSTQSQADLKELKEQDDKVIIPIGRTYLVIGKNQQEMVALANSLMNASAMKNFNGFSEKTLEVLNQAIQQLKLPANQSEAQQMTAMEYLRNFKGFGEVLNNAPKELQDEIKELLGSFQELAVIYQTMMQILSLEEQAAVSSLDEMVANMKKELKQKHPEATDEQINQHASQYVQQLQSMGMTAEAFKQMTDQARQQLEGAKQKFSGSSVQVLGKALITQDKLNEYIESKKALINMKVQEARVNRKDYESQTDLIFGFFMSLSNLM